jgi:trimethylamine---corrinoid protein Co-methyltransferase
MIKKLELLEPALIDRILEEAFQLLESPGVRVSDEEAVRLLATGGVNVADGIAHIPESRVRQALQTAPKTFDLYTRNGTPVVHYGSEQVHFDPGSCAVHVLDSVTREHRNATSADLIRIIKVTEQLPQFASQSTAVVCHDAPADHGDLYRLYLVLLHSSKPVVTGAFSPAGIRPMIELLVAESGSPGGLRSKPRAVFDVCPSPPLHWTDFACRCLIELGRAGIPVEMVSMPLSGATAPVTLAGSVVQHAAESLAGIVIHQSAAPSAPIVWGGAPAIFDMRTGTTPMGAAETAMLDAAYAQVGKSLGLPTHGYLCASDSKIVDAQAGLESGISALIGALAGINMISGAGMLDFLNCFSLEKLVIDSEAIGMLQRLLAGIDTPTDTLATDAFSKVGLAGEFLKLPETRQLFKQEQHLPSAVIDRGSLRAWQEQGKRNTFERATSRVVELEKSYQQPTLSQELKKNLENAVSW